MPADGDLPTGSSEIDMADKAIGVVDDFVSLFRGKKTSKTTNNKKTLNTTTKESEEVSAEKAMALIQRILGGTQGLAALAQGEKGSGLYNSTVNQQLTNDLLARSTAEVAALSSVKTTTQTGTIDDTNTDTEKKRGALEWIVCTELHRQGRLSNRLYVAGAPVFARTPVRVKAGYYWWAIPAVLHLRKHPYSLRSILLASIMNARAEYIAAEAHMNGYKKTAFGYITLHSLYAICWVLSRTVARKPVLFPDLHRILYK